MGLFNIIALWDGFGLCNWFAGQYHKMRLCYLALGWFYRRGFCTCGGFALCLFRAMCKKCVGYKKHDGKTSRRDGRVVGCVCYLFSGWNFSKLSCNPFISALL